MTGRNRGAAQASVMWVIALCVILVFVALFGFVSRQKVTEWESHAATQQADAVKARELQDAAETAHADLSKSIGFLEGSQGFAAVPALNAALENASSVFAAGDAKTVEAILPVATSAYQKLLVERRNLETEVAQLRADLEARKTAQTATLREKDQRIAELSREGEDTRNSLNQANLELERQRDSLRQQVADFERSVGELRTRLETQERAHLAGQEVARQRSSILSERLNRVDRRAGAPDGTVLTASASLSKAWIDLGRMDRIVPGMEFSVHDPADMRRKGRIKVVSVEDESAECVITDPGDRFEPIGADDVVVNALYDPTRQPIAVLLGNGFGRLSATDMKNKLAEVGVLVVDEVSNEADYLILGTPFFDEDTGDVVPWAARDEYRAAQEASLQILPLRDAMSWLGL